MSFRSTGDAATPRHAQLPLVCQRERQTQRESERAIADTGNAAYLSTASLWETAIKINIGKLKLPKPLGTLVSEQMRENEFQMLLSEVAHFEAYTGLPLHHRDPFDRMMIAQAQVEDLLVVSKEETFADYDIDLLW